MYKHSDSGVVEDRKKHKEIPHKQRNTNSRFEMLKVLHHMLSSMLKCTTTSAGKNFSLAHHQNTTFITAHVQKEENRSTKNCTGP